MGEMRDRDFVKNRPYSQGLGDEFNTWQEALKYVLGASTSEEKIDNVLNATYASATDGLEKAKEENKPPEDKDAPKKKPLSKDAAIADMTKKENLPYEYTRWNNADTSTGGNLAINPYPQFNYDSDPIHPLGSTGPVNSETGVAPGGMGRVYSEVFEANQQVMYLSMGVPEFTGLTDYFHTAFKNNVNAAMHEGSFQAFGRMIGTGIGFLFTIPFIPFKIANGIFDFVNSTEITKYYKFKPAMIQYYKMVNSILSHMAVSLGIYPNEVDDGKGYGQRAGYPDDCLPEIIKHHCDIFYILSKKQRRLDRSVDTGISIEEAVDRAGGLNVNKTEDDDELGFWTKFSTNFKGASRSSFLFVGFRVEKTTSSSESLSNSTGTSSIASTLNSKAKSAADTRFSMSDFKTGFDVVDKVSGALGSFVQGVSSSLSIDGIAAAVKGTGYFDIPDRWEDSKFSKNYNFTMKLRTPYGDKLSFFQRIGIPLAMIMGAAFPRSTGRNSYTSPFVIQAFCKGMFGIPLGIIDSLTITRGRSEHGWSYEKIPTAVDITFTIKDLSPAMFLSVSGDLVQEIMGNNDNMQEYINTLCGLGLSDRYFTLEKLKRKVKTLLNIGKNKTFNPYFIGASVGNLPVFRCVGALLPGSKVPNN